MIGSGKLAERLHDAWTELRENLPRTVLQTLGVILGVASVVGGFSISDSQRKRADQLFVRVGGLDKLNVNPSPVVEQGSPTALETANLGLRSDDADRGRELDRKLVHGASEQKFANTRVRSDLADQERRVTGVRGDFLALNGYDVERGRTFSTHDLESASPVAVLGSQAAADLFPTGEIIGRPLRIGDVPVTVIGVLREKVFRFRKNQHNIFAWRNRLVAVPAALVSRRMEGDAYRRLDRVTFRVHDLNAMAVFAKSLGAMLQANHRQQRDFRLDDVAARVRRMRSQGDIYDLVFLCSGILALLGGGLVNVNIQMASLKDRVREVGIKMAIGASGGEVFKSFITEALLVTLFGTCCGLVVGVVFSKVITAAIGVPLSIAAMSFAWAAALAGAFGFLFALYPAWKASRLSPMEALHYE
ncbi:MAG TPA: ABC transporter permease [Thermoanaerobaculia bacterium]|nr:ABC transporter permease [Thermoanaerobaculia bacterium]